jgi:hypothetical protein
MSASFAALALQAAIHEDVGILRWRFRLQSTSRGHPALGVNHVAAAQAASSAG